MRKRLLGGLNSLGRGPDLMDTFDGKLCTRAGGDMLAYLYDEMPAADRDLFEVHLADCGSCIDDFAELSQSRYPVYEWKLTEFEPLPTPRIVIPYGEGVSISWLGKLKAAFSFNPAIATAGAFATLAITALIGYAVIFNGGSSPEIAESNSKTDEFPAVNLTAVPENSDLISEPEVKQTDFDASRKTLANDTEKPVRVAVTPKRKVSEPAPPVRQIKTINSKPRRNLNLPVLSRVDTDEDDSLRLTDLFDEIGKSE